jgi:hypothetical protein
VELVVLPFAFVAFFAGMSLGGIIGFLHPPKPLPGFHFEPDPWGVYASISAGLNLVNFVLMYYFIRQPSEWRAFHLSKTTFIFVMTISYGLGVAAMLVFPYYN